MKCHVISLQNGANSFSITGLFALLKSCKRYLCIAYHFILKQIMLIPCNLKEHILISLSFALHKDFLEIP